MQTRAEVELRSLLAEHHPATTQFDVPLDQVSRWRIGGIAAAVVEPASADEAADVLRLMSGRPEPLLVVGEMSNLLFDSAGFDGVVLRIGQAFSSVAVEGTLVRAEAGVSVPKLARLTADFGLGGLEHTVGIPGTLGGLVTMNGGSQRKGIGSNVERVACLDRNGEKFELTREECNFAYRTSTLQDLDAVVVEVDLRLTPRDTHAIHAEMDAVVDSRRTRFPEQFPNCGSTFLSHPAMYASIGAPGRVIENAGLKGYSVGGAQVSPHHANFVVNTGGATSADVLAVIDHIRRTVHTETGILMDCEVRYVSTGGHVVPAHRALPTLGRLSDISPHVPPEVSPRARALRDLGPVAES